MSIEQIGLVVFAVAVIVGLVVAVIRERRVRRARELEALVRREAIAARRHGEPTDGSQSFPSLAAPKRPRHTGGR